MFKNVFSRSLYGLRWQALGWAVAVFAIVLLTMAVYNALSQQGIEQIVGQTPDSLKGLIGTTADYTTIPGYIGQQIFGPNLVIFTIIMAVMLFLSASSGQEERGLTQTMLALPVSRSGLYFQRWISVVIIIGLVCLAVIPGLGLGLLIVNHSADWARIGWSTFDCWLMNLAYGLVGYCLAMATGKRSLSIAVAAGYATISFIVTTLSPAVDWLKWPDKLSLFHYYNNPQIMSHGLNWTHVGVLLAAIIGMTLVGWLGFRWRDIRA